MEIVFLVNIIAVILAFCAKDSRLKICFPLAFVILTIFYGLRYDFGNDYWGYYYSFVDSQNLDFENAKEPGWHLLLYLCQPIGYFGFIILLTALDNFIIYKLIIRNVNRQWWWLSMFVFLFTFNFFLLGLSMIRQYFAMLICMIAADYLSRRKVLIFILCISVAWTIHFSSLIMLLCLLCYYIRPDVKNKLFIISFVALFVIMAVTTNNISSSIDTILQLALFENYSVYSDWEAGNKSFIGISFEILMLILVMISYPSNKSRQVFFLILVMSYIMLPFSYALAIITRLILYFSIFSIICYPDIFERYHKKWFILPLLTFYMLYTLRRTIASYTGVTYGDFYMSYHTILDVPFWI